MKWHQGQHLAPVVKPVITKERLRAYADASGDQNKIHLSDEFARAAGFPSVIAHGMLSMSFLADLIVDNFPRPAYKLNSFSVRFKKVTFPGDVIRCEGEVRAVASDPEEISLSVCCTNQNQQVTCEGTAKVVPV